ncbi:ribonuclease III [Sphaerobacter thermophilus]|jgi:ribonuclease-3|uniref:Ribonuclease 3 n=1 Tax=Sphaerobacter thermophilus (strain ATCC 49802 / DSM 20745 / KCCM 41009 / NCIMB 13125 / S 6022) TaxID=479434 RepID=D1C6L4_SPHTD|nr:ribonuclease III [Sphaerobacter thermophilus]ACZ39639.1 ribonuclease III [Sphaerobacter thermophilus DSM 20745]PZN60869.1 MAG: ribonuclease III [Sphaerobacter thermophilus]
MASAPTMESQRDPKPDDRPERAAQRLGIEFRDLDLLRLALTHRSYLNELGISQIEAVRDSNERLEFLGDSVLGMITAEFLYRRFPRLPEGMLTAYRTALVRTETLARWARRFGLDELLYLGRGEITADGEIRDRILAGAFEAVIAAIYLDRGIRATRRFLRQLLIEDAEQIITEGQETNYKGRLQELVQEHMRVTPMYRTVAVSGPAHDRVFTVEVVVGGECLGVGTGSSKRAAQQEAAQSALARLAAEGITEDHDRPL